MNLPHGCTVFEVSIHPTNQNTKKANVKERRYLNFLFLAPKFIDKYPSGKQIRIKAGINRLKNLKDKQNQISLLRETIITQLEGGYNPITDSGDTVAESSAAVLQYLTVTGFAKKSFLTQLLRYLSVFFSQIFYFFKSGIIHPSNHHFISLFVFLLFNIFFKNFILIFNVTHNPEATSERTAR